MGVTRTGSLVIRHCVQPVAHKNSTEAPMMWSLLTDLIFFIVTRCLRNWQEMAATLTARFGVLLDEGHKCLSSLFGECFRLLYS